MVRTFAFAFLTLFLGVLGTTPARAAEFHTIRSSKIYSGDALHVAQSFLQERTGSYDLGTVDLIYRNTLARGDYRTVRFVQQHDGLPVLGTAAVVRVSGEARVTVAAFQVSRDLIVSTTPSVGEIQVRTLLHSLVGPWAANGPLKLRLAVLPEESGPGRLVWQVDVRTGLGGIRCLVDAHRGVMLQVRNLAVETLGRVYPISSVVTPDATDVELTDLDDASPLVLTGWGGQFFVTNYVSGGGQDPIVAEQTLHTTDGTDFLYDPPTDPTDATDGFAQVGLYYHLTRIRDYFADNHAVDFSLPAYSLTAVANAMDSGQPMNNAYFSEQGMGAPWNTDNLIAIGQGATLDFADDSDVFLHEFTHYVSHVAVGYNMGQGAVNDWGLTPHSGSIDEGLADYFACTVNGDPMLGEASLALVGGGGRDLTDTSKVCPDDIFGEVHMDGELIGSVSWTLYESFGKAKSDQLIWGALTLLLPYATFGDFSQALVQTAGEMVTGGQLVAADVQTLRGTLDARGLTDCFNELPIVPDTPLTTNLFGLDLVGQMFGTNCQGVRNYGVELSSVFHFRATPEPEDEGVRLSVEIMPQGGSDLLWKFYARIGEHVSFSTGGGMFPVVFAHDYQTDWSDSTVGEMVIDDTSDPPFDPSQTYHFVMVHQNCPIAEVVLSVEPAEASGSLDAGVDSGVADASVSADASGSGDGGNKGCSCRTSGDAGGAVPLVLVLLILGLSWRRRRRG
jgi:MYXO-CTERM domain-containing protein